MQVTDVVVPISREYALASGHCLYTHAIVVSKTPFILVSETGDMRWKSTVKPEHFKVVGTAPESAMKRVLRRLEK